MILRRVLFGLVSCALLAAPRPAEAQERGAAALDQLLRGLPVTARVLMIGAHPDDEDTQLLSWLVRGHQVHAAYLSMTRGDGGQNEIGNDLGEALGVIRTEELLAARRVDGAQQYFSRAYDFGFSKSAEETFGQWDREALSGDVVRVIRSYRPHVIVSVFSGTPTDGHGHHQAAGILAREGYDAAMDTVRFPVRTHGQAWEPAKFYRGAWSRNRPHSLVMEVGGYDPVLGRSPAEIAGESRSQHRSQGFGSLQRRGQAQTRVRREASRVNEATPADEEESLFDGLDTSFVRLGSAVPDSPEVRAAIDSASALIAAISATVDLRRPAPLVAPLARLVEQLELVKDATPHCGMLPVRMRGVPRGSQPCAQAEADFHTSVDRAHARAQHALLEAAGIAIEATAAQELVAFADSAPTRITVHNRGGATLTVHSVESTGLPPRRFAPVTLLPDSSHTFDRRVLGLVDLRPWWIGDRQGAMFGDSRSPADGVALISYGEPQGLVPSVSVAEDTRRVSDVRLGVGIAGIRTTVSAGALMYRFADPVLGEQQHPVGGVPPITLNLDRGLEYARADVPIERRIRVTLQSHTDRERVLTTRLLVPDGLRVTGVPDSLTLAPGETRELFVELKGQVKEGRHEFGIGALSEGTLYTEGFRTIAHPHIRPQRMYRSAGMYLQAVKVTVPRRLAVLYVSGISDAVAPALRQLDVDAQVVSPADLEGVDLARFTTVVIGPRAYEASAELRAYNPRLLAWVRTGGTLVVQYGQFEMLTPGLMPYPIGLTRPAARVTLEGAPVQVIDPQARLLTWPNRLTDADWDGWVQERALYMPSEIAPEYRTPLGMNDPGEPLNLGGILEASVGRGRYVYVTLSLFRQIPAGVPGSVRVLLNLVSAGLPTGP